MAWRGVWSRPLVVKFTDDMGVPYTLRGAVVACKALKFSATKKSEAEGNAVLATYRQVVDQLQREDALHHCSVISVAVSLLSHTGSGRRIQMFSPELFSDDANATIRGQASIAELPTSQQTQYDEALVVDRSLLDLMDSQRPQLVSIDFQLSVDGTARIFDVGVMVGIESTGLGACEDESQQTTIVRVIVTNYLHLNNKAIGHKDGHNLVAPGVPSDALQDRQGICVTPH